MVAAIEEQRLQGIAQLLVHENLMDKAKALEYQALALRAKQSLLQYLVANNLFEAQQIALIIAQNFGVPMIDLNCMDADSMPISLVN